MNKIFSLFSVFLILGLAGFVLADSMNVDAAAKKVAGEPMLISAGGQGDGDMMQNKIQVQSNVRSGNFETSDGKQMMIQERSNNQLELKVGESKAQTGLQIDSKEVSGKMVLATKLSNGKDAEIKVMPDVASKKALERLQLKNCVEEDGCQLELKEVGAGDKARLAYEVKTEKQSRILGLFKKQMRVEAEVDAETGEVIRAGKPWWAFLASE